MKTVVEVRTDSAAHRKAPRFKHHRTAAFVGAVATALVGACGTQAPSATSVGAASTSELSAGPTIGSAASTTVVSTPGRGIESTAIPARTAPSATSATAEATSAGKVSAAVLPVSSNPIVNQATAPTLHIDSVLVENNVDANGKAASDHLEVALSNTGATDASGIEIFYSIVDDAAGITENYYTKLPADVVVPAGGTRVIHFDKTAAPDHLPVNQFSLYYTSINPLVVSVTVSATGAAVQTTQVKKDAGGAEAAD